MESVDPLQLIHTSCPWPRRLKQGPVTMMTEEELKSWIIFEDENLFVINKPGDIVCHPSKQGPWSSLVGAVREYLKQDVVHLIFRLDRETSGVVVLAKNPPTASRLQKAMQKREVAKQYIAILTGEMHEPTTVNEPLGDDLKSVVHMKFAVVPDGQPSITHFTPLKVSRGFTLAKVVTETGRKHQIRAHAQHIGHSLVGDKMYGPDAQYFIDFVHHGWSDVLEEKLLLKRQALHCSHIDLSPSGWNQTFTAPLPSDLTAFCTKHALV